MYDQISGKIDGNKIMRNSIFVFFGILLVAADTLTSSLSTIIFNLLDYALEILLMSQLYLMLSLLKVYKCFLFKIAWKV